MIRLLVIEDQLSDLQTAVDAARSIGITEVEARMTSEAAIRYLETGLSKEGTLPDGIVLDLDLGYESGYEIMRFWHSTPELRKIPVVVWSVLGEEQQEICKLFSVNHYVSKWEGVAAIRNALAQIFSGNER